MMTGKNTMLCHMSKLGWPEKHINVIALFFFKLNDHPMWDCPYGDEIIIAFQAKIRQEWHDALDRNNSFNISKINSDTLWEVADIFHDNLQAKG